MREFALPGIDPPAAVVSQEKGSHMSEVIEDGVVRNRPGVSPLGEDRESGQRFVRHSSNETVPKATEDGLQEGRLHPALRQYVANYGEPVDLATALSRAVERKKGLRPRIKGGVDDADPSLAIDADMPNGMTKTAWNPKHAQHRQQEQENKDGYDPEERDDQYGQEDAPTFEPPPRRNRAFKNFDPFGYPDPQGYPVPRRHEDDRRADAYDRRMERMEELMMTMMQGMVGRDSRQRMASFPVDHQMVGVEARQAVNESQEKTASEAAKKSRADAYLSSRTMVGIEMGGMSFTVPAVDVVESAYGVAVLMPTDGNGMMFTPKPMSDVVVTCDRKGMAFQTSYTGVSIPLVELGVNMLVFVKKPPVHAATPSVDPYNGQSMSELVRKLSNV